MIELLHDPVVFERIGAPDVTALTERATAATFFVEGMSNEQLESNRHVVRIAANTAIGAAANAHQLCTAAFLDGVFAGYMIATVHAPDNRELDWLMVDPAFHGRGVADALMRAGVDWLGADCPMWLTVIQHNERAIRFYRKHGFEVDQDADIERVVPHFIMRRAAKSKAV